MHIEEIKYPFFLEIRLKPKDIDYSKILLNWTKIIYIFLIIALWKNQNSRYMLSIKMEQLKLIKIAI